MKSSEEFLEQAEVLVKELDGEELERMLDSCYSLASYYMEKASIIKAELVNREATADDQV